MWQKLILLFYFQIPALVWPAADKTSAMTRAKVVIGKLTTKICLSVYLSIYRINFFLKFSKNYIFFKKNLSFADFFWRSKNNFILFLVYLCTYHVNTKWPDWHNNKNVSTCPTVYRSAYLPTYLLTYQPTYLLTYLPTYLPRLLSVPVSSFEIWMRRTCIICSWRIWPDSLRKPRILPPALTRKCWASWVGWGALLDFSYLLHNSFLLGYAWCTVRW